MPSGYNKLPNELDELARMFVNIMRQRQANPDPYRGPVVSGTNPMQMIAYMMMMNKLGGKGGGGYGGFARGYGQDMMARKFGGAKPQPEEALQDDDRDLYADRDYTGETNDRVMTSFADDWGIPEPGQYY